MFPESHSGLWVTEVTRLTLGSRSHTELRVPGSSGTPVYRSQPDLQVPGITWNSGFLESPGNLASRIQPELRVS